MLKSISKYLFAIIFIYSVSIVHGQESKLGTFSSYEKKAEKLKLSNAKYYYENNIDISKFQKYKSLGIDLKEMERRSNTNFKEAVLFSDAIVAGTIVKREYDTNRDSKFHTILHIKVNETYKTLTPVNPSSIIKLKLMSGKVEDRYKAVSHEPEFFLGEEVILYLNDSRGERMKKFIENGKSLDSNFERKVFANSSKNNSGDSSFYTVNKKYLIKAGLVFDTSKRKVSDLSTVKKSITEINKI